jgi:predicted Zn finger-like uncharacterized protein
MSLITSCPHCGTMFRVVPDQLKISEGWVRCGHCSEVFDATAHLADESVLDGLPEAQGTLSAPLESTQPEPTPAPPPPPPPVAVRRRAPAPAPVEPQARAAAAALREPVDPVPEASDRSEEPSDFFAEEGQALEPSPLDAPFVFRRPEVSLADLEHPPEPGAESQILPEDLEPPEEEIPDVSFVRKARRRNFWRRPFVRLVLALCVLLLGGLLAGQVAYQDRDRLALAQPALRPALEQMCTFLQCQLGAPRQIESVVIDSSGFNRLRNDTYRLSFTLRNTAAVPVAVPAMELTVTDAQDQIVARRVLMPAELGVPDATIPATGEWSRALGVSLATGGGARVAGYRLLAFYP